MVVSPSEFETPGDDVLIMKLEIELDNDRIIVPKICVVNGHSTQCVKIGNKNNIGVVKSYCCKDWAKIYPKYTKDKWGLGCKPLYSIARGIEFMG